MTRTTQWWFGGLVTLCILFLPAPGSGQSFSSGSTGADGAFNPTSNTTLTLPATGVFNFTTITIPAGVTVTFTKNAANTPVVLLATGTTLNVQSFMGAIMAIGIAVANSILLVTFAEFSRHAGSSVLDAGIEGGRGRLRAILMTAAAMIAGMLPIALGIGEGADQTAPLGRAVIGGLMLATVATLTILPAFYAIVQRKASLVTSSLHPMDPQGRFYEPR